MGSVGLWVGLDLGPNFHYGMGWVGLGRRNVTHEQLWFTASNALK